MFASETVNDITSDITGFLTYLPNLLNGSQDLPTKNLNLKPQTMKNIYTYLFSAFQSISESIITLFPAPGSLSGLSQMQPVFVPTTNKKF